MKIFRDTGVAYLDSVENFEQICADFIHGISFKFFLDRKGALWHAISRAPPAGGDGQ